MLENRIDELEARPAEAQIENERLRAEAEFDRQLRSGDQAWPRLRVAEG